MRILEWESENENLRIPVSHLEGGRLQRIWAWLGWARPPEILSSDSTTSPLLYFHGQHSLLIGWDGPHVTASSPLIGPDLSRDHQDTRRMNILKYKNNYNHKVAFDTFGIVHMWIWGCPCPVSMFMQDLIWFLMLLLYILLLYVFYTY